MLGWRARGYLLAGLGALVPLIVALAISVEMPNPSVGDMAVVVGGMLGVVAVIALMLSTRYTLTLTLLALYLGLLDGPIKLEATNHKLASSLRDILIVAIVLGMLMRPVVRRERLSLPPLSGWVLAFVAFVLVEALNPHTGSILKSLGGYRQQLEWVPFFFFGYLIMRSKQRFRQLFLLLGVIALANGLVGAYQSRLSTAQLASWGPGYNELVKGGTGNGITARTYSVEGVAHARPPALGSDSGFGGGVGVLALPGLLALLATGRTASTMAGAAVLHGGAAGGRHLRLAHLDGRRRGRAGRLCPALGACRIARGSPARGARGDRAARAGRRHGARRSRRQQRVRPPGNAHERGASAGNRRRRQGKEPQSDPLGSDPRPLRPGARHRRLGVGLRGPPAAGNRRSEGGRRVGIQPPGQGTGAARPAALARPFGKHDRACRYRG